MSGPTSSVGLSALGRQPTEAPDDWIDRLIDHLVAARRDGRRVEVEDYAGELPELAADRGLLLELIVAEWTVRRMLGEPVRLSEYLGRFAELGSEIEDHWQAECDMEPRDFGPFRLTRPLGRGGLGSVHAAEPILGGEEVALKVPLARGDRGAETQEQYEARLERFRRESGVMLAVDHPNICLVLEVGETDGIPWFTMPIYANGSVADELECAGGFLDERAAARRIIDAARGLEHAHSRSIIHRDLKPGNLLRYEANGVTHVVVADFGMALWYHADVERVTQSGVTPGTVAWFSPEQARGNRNLGPGSDVFSLCVVLYELLSGRLPFQGSPLEVLVAIAGTEPPSLAELRPGISPALVAICAKGMSKECGDRYRSMSDLADDLERFLNDQWFPEPGAVSQPTVETPAHLRDTDHFVPARRRALWPWLVAVGVLIAVLVVGLAVRNPFGGTGIVREKDGPVGAVRAIVSKRSAIGLKAHWQALHDDLARMEAVDRPRMRYLSLRAVHDNPYVGDDDLNAHQSALERVLTRLSRNKPEIKPKPVDGANSLFRIDLRELGWDAEIEWEMLRSADPYSVRHDAAFVADDDVRRLAVDVCGLIGVKSLDDNPMVRADWLLARATRAPLFGRLQGDLGGPSKTPPFDLSGPTDTLARVQRLYDDFPLDHPSMAAELGVRTASEMEAGWPTATADGVGGLPMTATRRAWSGEDGPGLFREGTRVLKLGKPGPAIRPE